MAKNRMQNRMRNSCLDLITRETWRLNPLDHYAWENIRGQSRIIQNRNIGELKEMLQITV